MDKRRIFRKPENTIMAAAESVVVGSLIYDITAHSILENIKTGRGALIFDQRV